MADPVPWTFNAGGTVAEQLTWLTDVLPATTGPEQTRKLREAPRTVVSFGGLETARNRRWLETLLIANGAGQWLAPLVMDVTRLSAPLSAASTSVPIDTATLRFVAGGQALLIAADLRHFEVVALDAVSGSALTLVDPTTYAWGAGTRVIPLRVARLDTMPSLSRFTGDAAPYQVAFRLEEPLEETPDAGDATYRTAPVLEWTPTWSSDPEFVPERRLLTEDEGTGPVAMFDLVGIPLGKLAMNFTLVGRSTIAAFRGLLFALCGRWSPIWVPSQAQDMRIVATVANGATSLDVEHCGFSGWPLSVNRRDLRIKLHNGTVLYRRITDAEELSSSVERLTLDSSIATGFAAADVAVVSFMALCRQDTDVNKLTWWNHDTVQTELTFRAVSHEL
jgi:hypothetical protein